ncbi:MAG: hypothetical protein GX596_09685 [Propionibacterium sp.]|nr:hypothetical protein [Propionibacterium sp.]
MGLFDRVRQAFAGNAGAQAQAQQLAADAMRQAGYTDGTIPSAADFQGSLGARMAADQSTVQAYGDEIRRITAVGTRGTSVITSSIPTGEQTVGNLWYQLEVQVTLAGQAPYTVTKRELLPQVALAQYAEGTLHDVAVDPADPQKIAFTS